MSLSNTMTLNQFFDYWQKMYRTGELKESTRQNEIAYYQTNIAHIIGNTPLNNIKPEELKTFLLNLSNKNKQRVCKRILDNMFMRIQDNGLLPNNPMKQFKIKFTSDIIEHDEEDTSKNKYLSLEEREILLNNLRKSKYYYITAFILETGLRKGEALALTWQDINGHIRINKSYNSTLNQITTPKTAESKRLLPLFTRAKAVLDSLPATEKVGRIFKDINSQSFTITLARVSERVLGYKITPHDLRHTFASYGLENGVAPKIMQKWLGHSSIQTTLNIYMHASKQQEDDAISIMNK